MSLTDEDIQAAVPESAVVRLWDGQGLYLQTNPSGGKWWRFKYRFEKKEKLLSFGVHPEVSLSDARRQREEAHQLLENGIDPSAARKEEKARETAERSAADGKTSVRFGMDGVIEIWKGKGVMRLTQEEACFVKSLLPG